jgi:hypothetical protein
MRLIEVRRVPGVRKDHARRARDLGRHVFSRRDERLVALAPEHERRYRDGRQRFDDPRVALREDPLRREGQAVRGAMLPRAHLGSAAERREAALVEPAGKLVGHRVPAPPPLFAAVAGTSVEEHQRAGAAGMREVKRE